MIAIAKFESEFGDIEILEYRARELFFGSSGNRVGKSNGECGLKAHRD
jgi:hypothetical protein